MDYLNYFEFLSSESEEDEKEPTNLFNGFSA
jgi:hypothetical protein